MFCMRSSVCLLMFWCLAIPAHCVGAGETKEEPKKEEIKKDAAASPEIGKALADLGSPDAALKESGAKALIAGLQDLTAKAEKPYLGKLGEALKSDNAATRTAAIETLIAVVDNLRHVGDLLAKITDKVISSDPKIREDGRLNLMHTLNAGLEVREIQKLINDLGSPDAAVVASASKQLQAFGSDAADELVSAFEDDRLAVKKNAAEVLKAMGPAAKDTANDLAFLLDNDNKGVRRLAANVLENLGPDAASVVSDMVSYLDHDEKSVRRQAANILKKMGAAGREATPDLVTLLTDDDHNKRSLAEDVLENLGANAKEGTDALIEIIESTDNDADAKTRATKVLGAIGPDAKASLAALRKNQDQTNADFKEAINEAIKKIELK